MIVTTNRRDCFVKGEMAALRCWKEEEAEEEGAGEEDNAY